MNGNLFEGDYVVINKLAYGARLPLTPLSFGNKYLDWIRVPYTRVFGYSDVQRNDIVAFNFSLTDELPVDMREEYIKRCVALPGDTLQVKNGIVFVNSASNEPANIYNLYHVVFNEKADTVLLKSLNIAVGQNPSDKDQQLFMSTEQAAMLLKTGTLKSVTLEVKDNNIYDPAVFPNYPEFKWNMDQLGPIYIPREGDSIKLTLKNLLIYQRIIERFEKAVLSFKNDSVFVDGTFKNYFTFDNDYYFMIGDNRHNSTDSRHWGFIPRSHIIGRASMVLHSKKERRNFLRLN